MFEAEFQGELQGSESIYWAGQPSTRVIFHPQDLYLIPFSLLWGGFAIFWEAGVLGPWPFMNQRHTTHDPVSWFMALWGIPFVVVGQYMIWGRFLYAAWLKRRIFYAVTNQRVLILSKGRRRNVLALSLASLPEVGKSVRSDGLGTLRFGTNFPNASRRTDWGAWNPLSLAAAPIFLDIEGAEQVFALVNRLKAEASAGKPKSNYSF